MGAFRSVLSGLLEYETQKVVQIHSTKIGLTFRLIQLGIILYVILWVMIYEKGYQSFDQAVSGVTAKLKGIAFANVTDNPKLGATVWDAADYVIPPQQNSAFFVMTNLVYTPGQTLGRCEEAHDVFGNSCKNDSQCHAGQLVLRGSGIQTGRCVNSTRQANLSVCEIYGWCPTEHDIVPRPHLLASAENFTVILKNSIEFPKYRVKRRNILSWMSRLFLKTCLYDPNDEKLKYCPIFRLGDILKYSGSTDKDIWETGGMVSIHIEWNCNLDFDEEKCLPKYVFRRLDDFRSHLAKGWNFRFSHHYIENGVRKRNLIKAYGIQFFITVYGTGGKFNVLTFSMNLGSGLALLGIATVLCDMIILNTTRKRSVYRRAKVDLVAAKRRKEQQQSMKENENKNVNSHFGKNKNKKSKLKFVSTSVHADDDGGVEKDFTDTNNLMTPGYVSHQMWSDKRCKRKPFMNSRSTKNSHSGQLCLSQPSFLGFHVTPLSTTSHSPADNSEIKEENESETILDAITIKPPCVTDPVASVSSFVGPVKSSEMTTVPAGANPGPMKSTAKNEVKFTNPESISTTATTTLKPKINKNDSVPLKTVSILPQCCENLTNPNDNSQEIKSSVSIQEKNKSQKPISLFGPPKLRKHYLHPH
ncbi:unnamed protein product [Trichobilharzia szidati]|nr:unnamed protein product [Trichobilharzia szidati]